MITVPHSMETHATCVVWDPFPTADKSRHDGMAREDIVKALVEKYAPWPGMLIDITIYDVAVVKVNGITFRSDPLNKQIWSKT